LNSLHVIVSAFGGAGTSGRLVFGKGRFGMLGIGRPGSDVGGVRDVVSGGPGSVVCATVPVVVRAHPVARPTRINPAAVTRTSLLICATIGATAT
jgi:hypothetical protein